MFSKLFSDLKIVVFLTMSHNGAENKEEFA